MMEQIENRMVIDSLWVNLEKEHEVKKKLNGPGYEEIMTGIFVPEECVYEYALERISLDDDLKQKFVEWFYSGNWVKKE